MRHSYQRLHPTGLYHEASREGPHRETPNTAISAPRSCLGADKEARLISEATFKAGNRSSKTVSCCGEKCFRKCAAQWLRMLVELKDTVADLLLSVRSSCSTSSLYIHIHSWAAFKEGVQCGHVRDSWTVKGRKQRVKGD